MRRTSTGKGGRAARRSGGQRKKSSAAASTALGVATVTRIVTRVLAGERRTAEVSVAFIGPARMRTLNREWKGHDEPTDVISFHLPGLHGQLVGDVYICPAVARTNARAAGISPREELTRLVVHGTLHVLGYDHPEGPGRTRSDMWKRQERYVKALA